MTIKTVQNPIQHVPLVDGEPGLLAGFWFQLLCAFAVAINRLVGNAVRGFPSLTNPGAIPKVSEAGTLAESALADDGAEISIAGRDVRIDNAKGYYSKDSGGTNRVLIFMGAENPDILHIRNAQRGVGGKTQFEGPGGLVLATLDESGNLDIVGSLTIGGTVPYYTKEEINLLLAAKASSTHHHAVVTHQHSDPQGGSTGWTAPDTGAPIE